MHFFFSFGYADIGIFKTVHLNINVDEREFTFEFIKEIRYLLLLLKRNQVNEFLL